MFVYNLYGNDTLLITILLVYDIVHLQSDHIIDTQKRVLEFEVRDMIFLKVTPWKGVI